MRDGRFAPDSLVIREQAATMLYQVYTKLGGSIPAVIATAVANNISLYELARNSVAFMSDKGILSGEDDNTYNLKDSKTVEQQ